MLGVRWTDRRLRALAAAVTATSLLLTVAGLSLHLLWRSRLPGLTAPHPGDVVLAVLYPLAGLLVLWHRPRNPAGWVLLSAALVGVSVLSHQWSDIVLRQPGALPWLEAAIWLSAWTYVPYWAQPSLLPLLFPDGRLPNSRRSTNDCSRVRAAAAAATTTAATTGPAPSPLTYCPATATSPT